MSKRTSLSESDILTVEEVAAYLKVTQRSIYNLLARQKLPAFRIGGSWRFRRDEIEAMTRGKAACSMDIGARLKLQKGNE